MTEASADTAAKTDLLLSAAKEQRLRLESALRIETEQLQQVSQHMCWCVELCVCALTHTERLPGRQTLAHA